MKPHLNFLINYPDKKNKSSFSTELQKHYNNHKYTEIEVKQFKNNQYENCFL